MSELQQTQTAESTALRQRLEVPDSKTVVNRGEFSWLVAPQNTVAKKIQNDDKSLQLQSKKRCYTLDKRNPAPPGMVKTM